MGRKESNQTNTQMIAIRNLFPHLAYAKNSLLTQLSGQLANKARDLSFGLSLCMLQNIVFASNEGSGNLARPHTCAVLVEPSLLAHARNSLFTCMDS